MIRHQHSIVSLDWYFTTFQSFKVFYAFSFSVQNTFLLLLCNPVAIIHYFISEQSCMIGHLNPTMYIKFLWKHAILRFILNSMHIKMSTKVSTVQRYSPRYSFYYLLILSTVPKIWSKKFRKMMTNRFLVPYLCKSSIDMKALLRK